MAFPQILEPLQCKIVFNRYLAIGRSNQKNSKNKVHLFSNFASGRTSQLVPNPFNWSPTHSTGPQKLFFTEISVSVAQIKKIQKTRWFYFRILLLGGPSPPSQLVPNPFNWSPKTVFYSLSVSVAQIKKNQKTISIYFLILQSTGPQPIQLVPKQCFLQIYQYRSPKSKKFKKRYSFVFF